MNKKIELFFSRLPKVAHCRKVWECYVCLMLESRAVKLGMQIAKVQQQEKNQRVFASAQTVCPGYNLIRRWIPKGMLPHFVRKIHHLHGISRRHNQQTSPGESFAGGASNKWLWHRPPEHHCNPATAPYLSLFGVSSPSMRPQLGCHPRSPTIQVPQNKASENSWHGMEWYGMVWKPGSSTPSITSYIYTYVIICTYL